MWEDGHGLVYLMIRVNKEVKSNGVKFLEKRLDDGRGVRLNMDHTFKTFLD